MPFKRQGVLEYGLENTTKLGELREEAKIAIIQFSLSIVLSIYLLS